MKHGDFTELAKFYNDRPGYSAVLLDYIKSELLAHQGPDLVVADVGAGTGKLTEVLGSLGITGTAVEPNDAMRAEGMKYMPTWKWQAGTAEVTNLPADTFDWLLMGSSFHWADADLAAAEFRRVLKPGGVFTAIWNPRDIESSELHTQIEAIVRKFVPDLKRVSSGNVITTDIMRTKLGNHFKNIVFMEASHEEIMTKERYLNIWRSVNDIRVQAGEDNFAEILDEIAAVIAPLPEVVVPYKSRAWTAEVVK